MKVAIVINTSWNVFNFRMNLIKSLEALGHEVHVVAPRDKFTHLLIQEGCIHHPVTMDSRGANPIRDFGLLVELFFVYRRIKPDFLLHYTIKPNIYGTLAASLLRIPVINNVCGLGTIFLKNDLVSRIAMLLYRISFRLPRKVFFQNPDDLKLFINKGLVPINSVDLLPGSGIDLDKFKPMPFRRNETFTFLLISRLITDKGILEYIEAVKTLRSEGLNAKFQLLGALDPQHRRGIHTNLVKEWVDSGIVEYLGSTEDVREFISRADCIVLPSYREGTPRTLLEAASSSKPIIATNVPGCNHVVDHNVNGLLCNLKDSGDLADKMRVMTTMGNEILKQLGLNGRAKVEAEYDETLVINKYLSTLTELKSA
jgi:glycosyltransferase involved in cell wall biosynthesis